ncbi:MAG: hypothetical protein ACJ8C4_05255 [Gemmataceae bacterium]
MAILRRDANGIWSGRLFTFRLLGMKRADQWIIRVSGRHPKYDKTFTADTIEQAAAQARDYIERLVGQRRD